jgi:hypothetical protein
MYADQFGKPIVGGKLYSYIAGTDTPQPLYTDVLLAVPYTNPIILDAAGTPGGALYPLANGYKLNLLTSDDEQVDGWPIDNIIPSASV